MKCITNREYLTMNEKIKQQSNLDRFGFKAKSNQRGNYWLYASLDFYDGIGSYGVRYHLEPGGDTAFSPAGIKPETICQCTGIRDSVGRLIYENDIVQVADRQYTVVYHEPSNTREIQGETDDRSFTALQDWIQQGVKCIVTGNKFDKEEWEKK